MAEEEEEHEAGWDAFLDRFRGPERYAGALSPENWEQVRLSGRRDEGGPDGRARLHGLLGRCQVRRESPAS